MYSNTKQNSPYQRGFPHCSVGKESACNAGDPGWIPGSGRSLGEGNGNPPHYSCLENPMDRGVWQATVHRVGRVGHDLATKPPLHQNFCLSLEAMTEVRNLDITSEPQWLKFFCKCSPCSSQRWDSRRIHSLSRILWASDTGTLAGQQCQHSIPWTYAMGIFSLSVVSPYLCRKDLLV